MVLTLVLVGAPAAAKAPDDPLYPNQWGMIKIGAASAWDRATGKGIVIAIVDTGIHLNHEDLKDKLVPGKDFLGGEPPQDEDTLSPGHGTHVSGIAGAKTFNGKGVVGVAPDAKLMPVRVLDEFGSNINLTHPDNAFANTALGITWAVDNGAKVINISFGDAVGTGPDDSLAAAIEYAWSKDAICVIAAGNDATERGRPSGYTNENAVVVAATASNDTRASYSNFVGDAKWGLSAPGSAIRSTYYDPAFPNDNDEYADFWGTSMAAPHVSGALAVLLSMGLAPAKAIDTMLATATDLGLKGVDSTYGAGRLNLAAAVKSVATSGVPSGGGSTPGPSQTGSGGPESSGDGPAGGASDGKGGPENSRGETADEESPSENAPGSSDADEGGASDASDETEGGGPAVPSLMIGAVLLGAVVGAYAWGKIKSRGVSSAEPPAKS